MQAVVSDIYNKLNSLLQPAADAISTTTNNTTNSTTNLTLVSIQGASGTAGAPQYALIPRLAAVPSNNPTFGQPYTQEGLLIQVNSQFWRYSLTDLQWQQSGTATAIVHDTHASRVTSYPAVSYPNAFFLETDTLLLLESNAATWRTVAGQIDDTHAHRLSNFPSVQFSVNTPYFETDRTSRYWVQNATGTVTVTGGVNVAWVSGNHFINTGTGFNAAQWPAGTPITINGVVKTVATVVSSTSLTLQSATTNAAGVSYSVASGRWVYVDGEMQQAWANLPADLGENDVATNSAGFLFFDNVNSLHIWQWTGAVWGWGPGNRASGEIASFDADPGTGWHQADGSVVTKYAANGTRNASFTLPDAREFYLKWSATYTGTGVAAVAPIITPAVNTGSAVTGASIPTDTGNDSGIPQLAMAGVGVTVPAEPHTHPMGVLTDPGHTHTIGAITAGTLGTPPTFAALPYYRL